MDQRNTPTTSYKEVKIGKTIYRVTSFFSGEKELGKTLEQLAVRRAMSEVSTPARPDGEKHRPQRGLYRQHDPGKNRNAVV